MRITPRRASSAGGRPSMEFPSRSTRPESGARWPLRMLMSVVLPEPFGPISPTSSPSSIEKLTPSRALTPPKLFDTLSMTRHGMATSLLRHRIFQRRAANAGAQDVAREKAPQPLAEEPAEYDDEQRENNELQAAEIAQILRPDIDQECADEWPGQRAEPADHRHANDDARLRDEAELGTDETGEMAVKCAGKTADGRADREGIRLPQHDLHATARGGDLVVSYGAEVEAGWCAQQEEQADLRERQNCEHKVIISEPIVEEAGDVQAEIAACDVDRVGD